MQGSKRNNPGPNMENNKDNATANAGFPEGTHQYQEPRTLGFKALKGHRS